MNFQIFKLDLEKPEEPEIKLPISAGSDSLVLETPWTVARQTPLSMGFSRQEYWSGLPFPSPEDLPDPGIEPDTPALQANSYQLSSEGNPLSVRSLKKQESSRKTSTSALMSMPKSLTMWITTNYGKFLKEMGIPDYLTCLLRNLYVGSEAIVRTGHGTTDCFQIVHQGCILSPCLFNLYAEYIMRNAGLDETQAGINTAGRNINNLRYADNIILLAES